MIFVAVAGIVLCAAGFTGYKVYENQTMSAQDIFLQQNLEALTQGETPDGPICTTYTSDIYYNYIGDWLCDMGEVRSCNGGWISWCYPGDITYFYNMDGTLIHTNDQTYMSTCN